MRILMISTTLAMAAAISGCHSANSSNTQANSEQLVLVEAPQPARPISNALPKAVIYRTNGDYNDNVPISVNADGSTVVSYPAPSDLTDDSTPLKVADGWLLDRRGIGNNTRFLSWTYAQYRALPSAPTTAELLKHIIPGARVTAIEVLPISANEAIANPSLVNDCIKTLTPKKITLK